MVQHFWEKYEGVKQDIIMRITSKHISALSRQVEESVQIEKLCVTPQNYLNNKSEWVGFKIPGLRVESPK